MKRLIILVFILSVFSNGFTQNRRSASNPTPTKNSTPSSPSKDRQIERNRSTSPSKSKTSNIAPSKESPKVSSSKDENSAPSESSSSSFFSPSTAMSTMSTVVEFGGYPSDADISFINVYGLLGVNFDISRRIYIGPYFRYKILSTTDYQVLAIDGKNLDMASFNEWGTGLSVGTYLPLGKTILLSPELRFGYNEYNIQDLNYTSTNKNFLNHKFLNFTPRLNIGFKMSDYSVLNFSGGYIFPYYLGNSTQTVAYNPGTFTYGLGLRFYLTKN